MMSTIAAVRIADTSGVFGVVRLDAQGALVYDAYSQVGADLLQDIVEECRDISSSVRLTRSLTDAQLLETLPHILTGHTFAVALDAQERPLATLPALSR